jgi:outer membrane immunogenic protein
MISSAQAAGIPYTWTGWYAGANAGGSFGRSSTTTTLTSPGQVGLVTSDSFNMNGGLGGLQAGKNWQINNYVWGVEADVQATGQKGGTSFTCGALLCTNTTAVIGALAVINGTYNAKLDWFGTGRLRGGMTITPTILAYGTGGLAWGHFKTDGTLNGFSALGATSTAFSTSVTKLGWTIGAGLEGRIAGNWTAKVEYLYLDFGKVNTTETLPTNTPALTANFSSRVTDNIVRVGLNYLFN